MHSDHGGPRHWSDRQEGATGDAEEVERMSSVFLMLPLPVGGGTLPGPLSVCLLVGLCLLVNASE